MSATDVSPDEINFDLVVAAEPRAAHLLLEIRNETPGDTYCANARWYGRSGLKDRMRQLVGWGRHEALIDAAASELGILGDTSRDRTWEPVSIGDLIAERDQVAPLEKLAWQIDDAAGRAWLWTSPAYDAVYRTLYRALPDCRGCACAGDEQ